jgi:hypothetical protein
MHVYINWITLNRDTGEEVETFDRSVTESELSRLLDQFMRSDQADTLTLRVQKS